MAWWAITWDALLRRPPPSGHLKFNANLTPLLEAIDPGYETWLWHCERIGDTGLIS